MSLCVPLCIDCLEHNDFFSIWILLLLMNFSSYIFNYCFFSISLSSSRIPIIHIITLCSLISLYFVFYGGSQILPSFQTLQLSFQKHVLSLGRTSRSPRYSFFPCNKVFFTQSMWFFSPSVFIFE